MNENRWFELYKALLAPHGERLALALTSGDKKEEENAEAVMRGFKKVAEKGMTIFDERPPQPKKG